MFDLTVTECDIQDCAADCSGGFCACQCHEGFTDEEDGCEDFMDGNGCAGHPAGAYDPMGQTVYCDGRCS